MANAVLIHQRRDILKVLCSKSNRGLNTIPHASWLSRTVFIKNVSVLGPISLADDHRYTSNNRWPNLADWPRPKSNTKSIKRWVQEEKEKEKGQIRKCCSFFCENCRKTQCRSSVEKIFKTFKDSFVPYCLTRAFQIFQVKEVKGKEVECDGTICQASLLYE